jgi:5-methylcytosine-specific restriction protein B
LPENLFVIATMNTADRTLSQLDFAMRRRFSFVTLKSEITSENFKSLLESRNVPKEVISLVQRKIGKLNKEIAESRDLGKGFEIGHSFFCNVPLSTEVNQSKWKDWFTSIVDHELLPLLQQYWCDDAERVEKEANALQYDLVG